MGRFDKKKLFTKLWFVSDSGDFWYSEKQDIANLSIKNDPNLDEKFVRAIKILQSREDQCDKMVLAKRVCWCRSLLFEEIAIRKLKSKAWSKTKVVFTPSPKNGGDPDISHCTDQNDIRLVLS